jgi:transitional endoplasmic reticulum ATPase
VIVVAATNRVELIDPAVLRSGRIDLVLELPLPDREARRAIFAIHTARRPLAPNVSLDTLARKSDGASGADIEAVCRRAANLALSEWMRSLGAGVRAAPTLPVAGATPAIQMRHFEKAIREAQERAR